MFFFRSFLVFFSISLVGFIPELIARITALNKNKHLFSNLVLSLTSLSISYLTLIIIFIKIYYSANAIEIAEYSSKMIIGAAILSFVYFLVFFLEIMVRKKFRKHVYSFFYLDRSATDVLISTLEPYEGKYELKYAASDAVMSIKFDKIPQDTVFEILNCIESSDGIFINHSSKQSLYLSVLYVLLIITIISFFTIGYIYPAYYL